MSATRFRSRLLPARTASVPMGQSSMSIVVRVPFFMKPMGGISLNVRLMPFRPSLRRASGGPSK